MKKNLFQKQIAGFLAILLFVGLFSGVHKASAEDILGINADASILIDANSGRVLYEKNSDQVLGIASMTKMMTEYLLLEAIKEGRVKWDQKYTVSNYVYNVSQDYPSLSNVPLRKGENYTIRELYEAMTIYSANGATIAIAETIAGSEPNFVKMMTEKAKELGLKDFKFVNATGVNNRDLAKHIDEGQQLVGGDEEENVMSARSVAKLAFRLLHDYPEVLETTSIPVKYFREGTDDQIKMENWNWMLPNPDLAKQGAPQFEGIDGLKTGTTDFAGACFTATASRNGDRYISVVMNAKGDNIKIARFDETKKLLNYAFSNFSTEEILPKHYGLKNHKTLPVNKGKEGQVKIYTKDSLKLVTKKGDSKNYKPTLVLDKKLLNEDGEITAPVKKGQKVGYITLSTKDGQAITTLNGDPVRVDVVTGEDVEKANWFVLSMRGIGGFFANIFGSVAKGIKGLF